MGKVNVVDLFAGCGGLSYGFQEAGFQVILGIDHDKDSKETFLHNHPGSKYIQGDIRKVDHDEIVSETGDKKVHILMGGPPCQGFSISGKRAYMDPRNSLYLEYFRILDILDPEVAIVENVLGIKSLYGGAALKNILSEFEKRGYRASYKLLKASDYGVPQIRKRIIIVATRVGEFSFPDKDKNEVTLGDAIGDLPKIQGAISLDKYASDPVNDYQKLMRKRTKILSNHEGTNHTEKTKRIISLVPEGGNYKNLPDHLRDTRKVNIAWTRLNSSKPSTTIDTGHRHHFHPWENRVPTVRESARIQSFPDDFVFKGSKTSQYRQVGNAVPPMLANKIALQIKKMIKNDKK